METIKTHAFNELFDLFYRDADANTIKSRFNHLSNEILLNENLALTIPIRHGLFDMEIIIHDMGAMDEKEGVKKWEAAENTVDRILSECDKEQISNLRAILDIVPEIMKKPHLEWSRAEFGYLMVELKVLIETMEEAFRTRKSVPLSKAA